MDPETLRGLAAAGIGVSVVLLFFAVFYPVVMPKRSFQRRLHEIAGVDTGRSATVDRRSEDVRRRRIAVERTLREMEEKQRQKARQKSNPSLMLRIQQAKLDWTRELFWTLSGAIALAALSVAVAIGIPLAVAVGGAVAAGWLMPRWFVNYRRARVFADFIKEFPNAIDIVTRGIRSGLPLKDCLAMIAQESAEPVRSEFARLVDDEKLGIPLTDAVQRLADRVPVTEAAFFATVIAMQAETGGRLSEALGNLSQVMREHARMRAKIRAMSMEAKSSGIIIGSMPVVVAALVFFVAPDYIRPLFETGVGRLVLAMSVIWMGVGVFVMRQMINFDF